MAHNTRNILEFGLETINCIHHKVLVGNFGAKIFKLIRNDLNLREVGCYGEVSNGDITQFIFDLHGP